MAAVDDDESWLYGSNKSEEITTDTKKADEEEPKDREEDKDANKNEAGDGDTNNKAAENEIENGVNASANADTETEIDSSYAEVDRNDANKQLDDREAGELSGEEFGGRAGREDEDSDSDDDDVQVTIGDIKSAPSYGYGGAPVNLNIKRGSGYASGVPGVSSSAKTKGIDLDVVGSVNGVPTYEFNLDSLEDKPWRKPGADITDYFNYGFNEDTWKAYCEKQRKLRIDTTAGAVKTHAHGHPVKDQQIPVATVNENSKYAGRGLASAGPPPGRKSSGCIDVIGGSTTTSRRPLNLSPKENVIQVQVMTTDKRDYGRKPFIEGMPPPPPGLQPPHLGPPPGFIPPDLSIPPPGLPSGMLPPGLPPPGLPPPPPHPDSISGFPDHFGGFGPRGGYLPPIPPGPNSDRGFDGHGFPYGGGQTPYNPFEPTGEPPWEPLDRTGGQQYNPNWDFPVSERSMDKSPQHSPGHDDDPERRQSSRDRRDRDRFRDRDRDRERERTVDRERDRDRDRHGERDRERDYEYDERRERDRERRHREHRDRDKEHRSSRRKHRDDGEESEHGRSRHKRKRIKREKEDEVGGGSETQDTAPEAAPQEQEEAAE